MEKNLDKQREKLENEKQKILIKEKLFREKEKKKRVKQFYEIGGIAFKANIDRMDKETMLGAFLEISERLQKNSDQESWKIKANQFLQTEPLKDKIAFSVVFSSEPQREIKETLKENGFKWNRIRKEYLGYGSRNDLEKILSGLEAKICEI